MNIFITDNDPQACARNLDDVRLNKMILETAQMLCTVARDTLPDDVIPYKATHVNHPCTKWVRSSPEALAWTIQHFNALYSEKLYRTGKQHLSYIKLADMLEQLDPGLDTQLAPLNPVYAGDYPVWDSERDYTLNNRNIVKSYRNTMVHKWTDDIAKGRAPTWRGRGIPEWATRVYNGIALELVGYTYDEAEEPME